MLGRLSSGFAPKPRRSVGGSEQQTSLRDALRNRGGAKYVVSAPTDVEDTEVREKSGLDWLNLTAFPAQALQNAIDRLRGGDKGDETDDAESTADMPLRVTVSAGGKMANSRRHSMPTAGSGPPPPTSLRKSTASSGPPPPTSLRSALSARGGITRRPPPAASPALTEASPSPSAASAAEGSGGEATNGASAGAGAGAVGDGLASCAASTAAAAASGVTTAVGGAPPASAPESAPPEAAAAGASSPRPHADSAGLASVAEEQEAEADVEAKKAVEQDEASRGQPPGGQAGCDDAEGSGAPQATGAADAAAADAATAPTEPSRLPESATQRRPAAVAEAEAAASPAERRVRLSSQGSAAAGAAVDDNSWIGKPKACLQPASVQAPPKDFAERPKAALKTAKWIRSATEGGGGGGSTSGGSWRQDASPAETKADPTVEGDVKQEKKTFNDLTKFWGKKSLGFAGPSIDRGQRMSKNEAQATLQRLIAAGSKVDFDEVRRLRKLVAELE